MGTETIDTTYASASTYSDGQDSSSTTDHYEKSWDYVDDNLYNELITFQSDGGISYAWAEFGGGSGGWDWLSSGDDLNQSTWSYDGTDYTDSRDDHRSDSGFETYNYDYEDDLTVTVAADGSESIGGGWHQWGSGEGNADLHHWGTSSWTEQYTGSGYSSSRFDENTYDIVSNDSYLHTFDNSGSYPADDSYGGEMYGGDTYVSGDYQDTSTSSGNWTETYADDGYGGPGWTDGDSYSDTYTANTSYDELLTDASPAFWYYGYHSEQYAHPGAFSDITAGTWDDAIDFLTSTTLEETDDEVSPTAETNEAVDDEQSEPEETTDTSDSVDSEVGDDEGESEAEHIPDDLMRRLQIQEAQAQAMELLRDNVRLRGRMEEILEELRQQSNQLEEEKDNLEKLRNSLNAIAANLQDFGGVLGKFGELISGMRDQISAAETLVMDSFAREAQALEDWGEALSQNAERLRLWGEHLDAIVARAENTERILGPLVNLLFSQEQIDASIKNGGGVRTLLKSIEKEVRLLPGTLKALPQAYVDTAISGEQNDSLSGFLNGATDEFNPFGGGIPTEARYGHEEAYAGGQGVGKVTGFTMNMVLTVSGISGSVTALNSFRGAGGAIFEVAELSLAGGGTISVVRLSGAVVELTPALAKNLGLAGYGILNMSASDLPDDIRGQSSQRTKQGGRYTEPDLPPKTIVEEKGVKIDHYTRSGDHGPPHVHVKGGGPETKIGQNGKAIEGSPDPTAAQQSVIDANKNAIERAIGRIMRWWRFENKY